MSFTFVFAFLLRFANDLRIRIDATLETGFSSFIILPIRAHKTRRKTELKQNKEQNGRNAMYRVYAYVCMYVCVE